MSTPTPATPAPAGPTARGATAATPVLELAGIVKSYGQVQALRGAALTVYPGEVVALVGDNGAGKSTTIKVISGVIQPDAGEIRIDGRPVTIPDPIAARRLGIETVYQDLALAPDLDPAENLFLGREIMRPGLLGKLGFVDRKAMRTKADEAFGSLGVGIQDTAAQVVTMSGGQRQGIAVGRAVNWADRVLLMDEPTAALGVVQTQRVGQLIQRVRDSGVAVVLISHNLPFVFEYADRIEVLRLGQRVARLSGATATSENVLGAMTGALTFDDGADPEPDPALIPAVDGSDRSEDQS
ncbi:ATP-binding cassette domain-containing protein [Streptomyces turgidiscabies]|uniref:ABC transporter, ATP-binding protein n=1 Tax=Streptomyces turgidiscabies (strain Car8) TaxID=698760 RepID=L7F987_STRT8|nr:MULTISPECIES: ATP-binding cassette domain-containing protein [Streptomyces]ELP67812.1 ABC transporter, ATP-binding protein [Streptomyces turgidiscabies Car8]MDX3494277.1 ATP-binding cassette domain-containing protein [Streptomyces turgidiscabies]GAQ68349.1 ribose import ATP-binding protein RbsA [Streptomyces turgidiscabies]